MRTNLFFVVALLSSIHLCHSSTRGDPHVRYYDKHRYKDHVKSQSRKLWSYVSTCPFGYGGDVFVSSTFGRDEVGLGQNYTLPYASIQFAVDNRLPCQTIYVMEGLYRNKNYGLSDNDNAVVNLNGVNGLKITNYNEDCVIIEFDGAGGFVGGTVSNVEISGLEIIGPNEQITFQEAFANRLLQTKRYKGRGIAIWSGHHIHFHDLIVHHCPGSGIRVNKGDYVTIENSEVYSNTWWSSSAESAIVLAESIAFDEKNNVKMVITRNSVYDNINKVPYYNKNYEWNYSPIAGMLDCSAYEACKNKEKEDCPWQCRYGKETQDYIIDGSGVYITRNNESYEYGKFELSYNVCYENGINGLVMHRTNRGMIKQNLVYGNGIVPRLDKSEAKSEDWHEGCSGKSRQPYSGLVLNNAEGVKLWGNIVTARYDDDYAFIQISDSEIPTPILAGGNNHLCKGLDLLYPEDIVKFNSNPTRCIPDSEASFVSSKVSAHSCRKFSNYKDIKCRDNCHLIHWPSVIYASYDAPNARENCANDCNENDCKAFSLQMNIDEQNGDRLCILYYESMEPTLANCAKNPFNTYICSFSTVDGQFFITHEAAQQYEVKDFHS